MPSIPGWSVHTYSIVPAALGVNEKRPPFPYVSEAKSAPSSAFTSWSTESSLTHVTRWPTRTVASSGAKRMLRMPIVTSRESEFTPSTFNTEKLSNRALELFAQHFGRERVLKTPAVMGGEDFSRFWLADKSIESLIFWVGGTPLKQYQAAGGDAAKLPSLHSPYWAPDAEAVIGTATEAMTLAALDVLKKG